MDLPMFPPALPPINVQLILPAITILTALQNSIMLQQTFPMLNMFMQNNQDHEDDLSNEEEQT